MLIELHVEALGVIDDLHLVLGQGMTALTGETGAGKTLLVEAIELLVGGRADPLLVRPGASEARVEGRFVLGDDEVVVARVVPRDGRSRAYVDGRLATAAQLAELGSGLVDLHGQHAHQSLLATAVQRAALDTYGRVDLAPLQRAVERLRDLDAQLVGLGGDERARAREIDLLRFQVAELDRAGLSDPDEDEALASEEALLSGAQAHREAAGRAAGALADDGGALDAVGTALAALGHRAPFAAQTQRLRELSAELADVASELRDAAERIDDDPARLDAVRRRRQLLVELRRKYGDTLADVMTFHAEAEARLAELSSHEERWAAVQAERGSAEADRARAAAAVAAARRAAAPRFAAAVEANLRQLALPKARVEVVVDGPDPGDEVQVLFAANAGMAPLPLAKVASGGELARTMLALRLVLSEAPPTLLFDEVDAGIGGEAALAVGRALAALAAQGHQVLVVTHLAQVAAFADAQVAVRKSEQAGATVTTAVRVEGDQRIAELSRMLSGLAASSSARRHAEELLAEARALREGRRGPGPRRGTKAR